MNPVSSVTKLPVAGITESLAINKQIFMGTFFCIVWELTFKIA
jgi:hypothetical protein